MTIEKDLGPELKAWSETRHVWTEGDLDNLGTELATALDGEKDWDRFAGENWLVVVKDDAVLVYVYSPSPLVIVKDFVASKVREIAGDPFPCIAIPDSVDSTLKCDLDILKLAFPEDASGLEEAVGYGEFDPSSFSMGDLYFRTV